MASVRGKVGWFHGGNAVEKVQPAWAGLSSTAAGVQIQCWGIGSLAWAESKVICNKFWKTDKISYNYNGKQITERTCVRDRKLHVCSFRKGGIANDINVPGLGNMSFLKQMKNYQL